MKTTGFHTHRFADNPEEQRFAEAWDRMNARMYRNLPSLLGAPGRPPVQPTERDEQIAATVIQWLGSPVGQGFLWDLGYERKT